MGKPVGTRAEIVLRGEGGPEDIVEVYRDIEARIKRAEKQKRLIEFYHPELSGVFADVRNGRVKGRLRPEHIERTGGASWLRVNRVSL